MRHKGRVLWHKLSQQEGGAILSLAASRQTLLAGTASGLFQTNPESLQWNRCQLEGSTLAFVQALTIAPWGDWYVGTPSGLFRRTTTGEWQQCLMAGAVAAVRTTRAQHNRIVLVVDWFDGVLLSTDAGIHWEPALAGLPAFSQVMDMALSPDFERDPLALLITGEAVFVGQGPRLIWRPCSQLTGPFEAGAIVRHGEQLALLIAGETGISRSLDRGKTWHRLSAPLAEPCAILATDLQQELLFAGAGNHLLSSRDSGEEWERFPDLPSPVTSIALLEQHTLFCGTLHHGVLRWNPAQQAWSAVNQGLHGYLPVGLGVREMNGSYQLLLVDWSGVLTVSLDSGASWRTARVPGPLRQLAGGHSGFWYLLSSQGIQRSRDGRHWELLPAPASILDQARLLVGGTQGQQVILLQRNPARLWSSVNAGQTWQEQPFPQPGAFLEAADLSPDGNTLALIVQEGNATPLTLWLLRSHTGNDWQAHVLPVENSRYLVACRWDQRGEKLLLTCGQQLWIIEPNGQFHRVNSVLPSAPTNLLATRLGGWLLFVDSAVWVIDNAGTLHRFEPPCPQGALVALASVPEGRQLVAYAADVQGALWRLSLV